MRLSVLDGRLYLDLGDETWRAVNRQLSNVRQFARYAQEQGRASDPVGDGFVVSMARPG
jgi:hypothetical protein